MNRLHAALGRRQREDEGFTLIELLVVIIIIGILAAIAIPVFLNQRKKGSDAASKSDLRNLAELEEAYLYDYSTYGSIGNLNANESPIHPSKNVTLTVVRFNTNSSYCLSAFNTSSGNTWWWDSLAGGLQPVNSTACPTTTAGTAGGSLSNP